MSKQNLSISHNKLPLRFVYTEVIETGTKIIPELTRAAEFFGLN